MLLAMLFCFQSDSNAQLRDTLEEVNIRNSKNASSDDRINTFSPGQKIKTIDSVTLQQYQMQQVASLLTQQTPVFIKSYGLNGLATLNFRGSSAAQSQLLWNGVPIQNATLGMADVSLLPVSMINKLHIIYGSSSALWGSGNIGGALMLETDVPSFGAKNRYEFIAGTGSFSQYQAGGKANISIRRWSMMANVLFQSAKNNFTYEDELGRKQTTSNSELRGLTALTQVAYKASEKDVFRFAAWYQDYNRDIPAAMFESSSVKERKDESLRLLLDWNRKQEHASYYIKNALISDGMRYDDEAVFQHYKNTSYQYFFEAGWKQQFSSRHQLMIFTPVQISWMKVFEKQQQQAKYALALAYGYTGLEERLAVSLNLRGEVINNNAVLLPGINTSYALTKWLKLRGNLQNTYRAPSLNELYYEPGGNPDLKPEQGWSSDLGYTTKPLANNRRWSISHDLSLFNRVIDNWILWLGGAIWTPHNIATVHSRGIETENLLTLTLKKWRLHTGFNMAYVVATTISSYIPNDGSIGKQIPYTPEYNGHVNIGFKYNQLYFNYNCTYTSYRYVNVDESDYIPAYSTSNIQASYDLHLRSTPFLITAQINNIFNNYYQVVRGRSMPGLNWTIGARLSL